MYENMFSFYYLVVNAYKYSFLYLQINQQTCIKTALCLIHRIKRRSIEANDMNIFFVRRYCCDVSIAW